MNLDENEEQLYVPYGKERRSISDPRRFSRKSHSSKKFKKKTARRSTVISVPIENEKSNELIFRIPRRDEQIHSLNSVINENPSYQGTTQIKLSLPIASKKDYLKKHLPNPLTSEFTLPTNPPITVTIQPQNHLNEQLDKENSFHDDQICSPENLHLNQQKISPAQDPTSKNTSTIVNYLMDLLKPSDNKLAMKLFGSRKGVLKERLRQQRAGHCIIHPCSNFRFYSQRKKNLFINFDLDFIGI